MGSLDPGVRGAPGTDARPSWYRAGSGYDEAFSGDGSPRSAYADLLRGFATLEEREVERRPSLVDLVFRNQGITFAVYGSEQGVE